MREPVSPDALGGNAPQVTTRASLKRWRIDPRPSGAGRSRRRGELALGALGLAALASSCWTRPSKAAAALSQDWPPFVLVTGLLLIGLVAERDGLFAAAGHRLAGLAGSGGTLFAGAAVMIGLVTAVLNLDTSVAFLTPVLVYTAESRGGGEAPLFTAPCSCPMPVRCCCPGRT